MLTPTPRAHPSLLPSHSLQRAVYGLDEKDHTDRWSKAEPVSQKIEKRQQQYRILEQALSERGISVPVLPTIGGSPRAPGSALPLPIPGIPKSAWASPSKPTGDSPYGGPGHGGPKLAQIPKLKQRGGGKSFASVPSGAGARGGTEEDLSATAPPGGGAIDRPRHPAAARVLGADAGRRRAPRNNTSAPVGTDGYRSSVPRHRMPFNSRKQGSKSVSATWLAISGSPYAPVSPRNGNGNTISYERSVLAPRPPGGAPGAPQHMLREREAAQAARRQAMAEQQEAAQAAALLSHQVEALTRILPAAPHEDRGKLLRGVLNDKLINPHHLEAGAYTR